MIINTMERNMKCKTNNDIFFLKIFFSDEMQEQEIETKMYGWT